MIEPPKTEILNMARLGMYKWARSVLPVHVGPIKMILLRHLSCNQTLNQNYACAQESGNSKIRYKFGFFLRNSFE